eukprot:CAMPEP_0172453534 /NCGR_PEP_ID=MMETSP1065-20121228/10807_1 /TAXON_ID=265537 /ORGANISM="Amphiprora paludosa, Strain CCMP125" /LENGTH=926 /DNA_ID=CAMNT_0013205717 /DNA_START=69 /DNA_END=2849 /DNA_ORIENTATION=+
MAIYPSKLTTLPTVALALLQCLAALSLKVTAFVPLAPQQPHPKLFLWQAKKSSSSSVPKFEDEDPIGISNEVEEEFGAQFLTDQQLNDLEDVNNSRNGYAVPRRYSTMLDEPVFSRILSSKASAQRRQAQKTQRQQEQQHEYDDDNEDGWGDLRKKKRSVFKGLLKLPLRGYDSLVVMLRRQRYAQKQPGTLVLVRHGESTWNANKTFTGWADADLSERGKREVEHAARLLLEGGFEIDVVFTSRLKRAIRSVWIILQEMNQVYLPVFKSWRLNERMYGALTSLCKTELAKELGADIVQEWRSSLQTQPPPVTVNHPYWPGRERKYADLRDNQIPTTESLLDCMNRATPMWENKILYELRNGKNVMVVAHANTLRGLVKKIDNISDEEIQNVAIPTGIPIIYKFDSIQTMNSISPILSIEDRQTACQQHMNGLFLEKPGLLKQALAKEAEWSQQVPGYNPTMERSSKTPMSALERSLYKLAAERELNQWAGKFVDPLAVAEDDGTDGNNGLPMQLMSNVNGRLENVGDGVDGPPNGESNNNGEATMSSVGTGSGASTTPILSEEDDATDENDDTKIVANLVTQPCVTSMPSNVLVPGLGATPIRKDAVIVIIRHGKTEHNKLGLFTGWEDAPLAKDGVVEAMEAGRLLKAHGFEFDVVYTSWLARAIETAWLVMDQMDCLWLPIIKTWRLNERMYGQLTGLSKQMVKQRHGDEQFKAWRRGYKTPPPKVSSFSQHYPGNDRRYKSGIKDVRYSVRESLIRSIESGRPTLERKLPKTESLKDCMERTIPFFTEKIVPEAIGQGKRVLISSSENAIRGLLMHLCDIPQDKITGLEIPNGLPIIFDLRSKCVKLLDDGTGRDPLEVYNFGSAASYLFRPCQNEDGSPDEECTIQLMDVDSVSSSSTLSPVAISAEDQAALDAIRQGTMN